MLTKIIKIIKKILGENVTIVNKTFPKEDNTIPNSLKDYIKNHPESLASYKKLGCRKDKQEFSPAIKKIEIGYNLLYRDLCKYDNNGTVEIDDNSSIRSGSPLATKPFSLCREYIIRTLYGNVLYKYPLISGHPTAKQNVINYLIREGFSNKKEGCYEGLGIENVVFTCSTTHAYNMVLQTIARDQDVLLVTGPNYGLFAIEPEKMNIRVEVLDLRPEDDWFVNPTLLQKKIKEINKRLKKEYEGKLDYIPKVVAFLNMNPHNPLGKVMNNKNIDILKQIGDVCLEEGVFVIDDMVYRDLTYDQTDLAVPMASFPKYFNNTITLMGLSKCYGLAGIRAGVVVAPIPISHGLSEVIFSTMDSIPTLQIQAVAGAFNATNRRYRKAQKYFKHIINEYLYRLNLLEALVSGIDKIKNKQFTKRIIKDINEYKKNYNCEEDLTKGISGAVLRQDTYPESGFFAILDFTKIKGKKYGNKKIMNDADFIEYIYMKTKIKCITGLNMSWPNEEEIIVRASYSLTPEDLIHNFKLIKKALSELK